MLKGVIDPTYMRHTVKLRSLSHSELRIGEGGSCGVRGEGPWEGDGQQPDACPALGSGHGGHLRQPLTPGETPLSDPLGSCEGADAEPSGALRGPSVSSARDNAPEGDSL